MNAFDQGGFIGEWLIILIPLAAGIYFGWKYKKSK